MCRGFTVAALALAIMAGAAGVARAEFPRPKPPPGAESDYSALRAGPSQTPNDLGGDNVWKFAATPGGAPGEQQLPRDERP